MSICLDLFKFYLVLSLNNIGVCLMRMCQLIWECNILFHKYVKPNSCFIGVKHIGLNSSLSLELGIQYIIVPNIWHHSSALKSGRSSAWIVTVENQLLNTTFHCSVIFLVCRFNTRGTLPAQSGAQPRYILLCEQASHLGILFLSASFHSACWFACSFEHVFGICLMWNKNHHRTDIQRSWFSYFSTSFKCSTASMFAHAEKKLLKLYINITSGSINKDASTFEWFWCIGYFSILLLVSNALTFEVSSSCRAWKVINKNLLCWLQVLSA